MYVWLPTIPPAASAPITRATTLEEDPERAVASIAEQLGANLSGVLCFVSSDYERDRLAASLTAAFPESCVVGCTTSGQIGADGFQPAGISAVGFGREGFAVTSHLITPLDEMTDSVASVSADIRETMSSESGGAFGLLLVDGMSMVEEKLAAALYAATGHLPIIGGSAGDDLRFANTFVLADGRFRENAAVLTLVRTRVPFATVKAMHHEPTDAKLVITSADPEQRLVHEISGYPAAEAYSQLVGVPVEELTPQVFSKHPVMLRMHNEYYIRSIQRVEPDQSIRFYCAIEEGLVLTLARPVSPVDRLRHAFELARQQVGRPSVVLGCDCILRRLELEEMELDGRVGALLAKWNVVGFSTYGEQLDGLHVNQTFTGIAIGGGE